jgi:hypothetical protein
VPLVLWAKIKSSDVESDGVLCCACVVAACRVSVQV